VQPVAERGGSDQALLVMIQQLSRDGWDCHVAVPGPSPMHEEFAAAGATLHIVAMRRLTLSGGLPRRVGYVLHWPASVLRLTILGRRLGAGVVHTNSLHSWYGWAAAALLRRPHVWHAREIVTQSPAALRIERWMARRAARVIAISGAVAAQLDPANVTVVTDEPDPAVFDPVRAGAFRPRAGLADGRPLVGSVGRIDTWKGFDVLLDAVPLVQAARPGTMFAVAGPAVADKEDFADRLAARAAALPDVHWLGLRTDIADLLADLDVFVLPSTEPEPFGLVVVEALASGVPVVATAAGGPLEIMGSLSAGAGTLVAPGDAAALARAVVELLPETSNASGRRGRHRLRIGPPPAFGRLFDEVLSGAGPPGRLGRGRRHRPRSGPT
jgi:glycosyltransferase involved in cell wall biosynthesis